MNDQERADLEEQLKTGECWTCGRVILTPQYLRTHIIAHTLPPLKF